MDPSKKDSAYIINDESAYTKALLRALSFAKVQFVRFAGLDLFNTLRCKAVPVDCLKKKGSLDLQVAFAKVVFGGLPSFGDVLQPSSGLDASDTLVLRPDLSTLRVLPYAPKSAMVFGYLYEQRTGQLSDLCSRGLLRSLRDSLSRKNLALNVGAEVEFCLVHAETNQPVDASNFADSALLNEQEGFLVDLYDQLSQQDIEVELIHAESAPGQLELVLPYQNDPVRLADNVVFTRECVRNVAHSHGLKAVFLPKLYTDKAGSGCHLHLSVCDMTTGENLFIGKDASDIGLVGQHFIEGILQHLRALLAVTVPTASSFRRVGEGCWTGHDLSWGFDDKETPLRVVFNHAKQRWDRVEYKLCDSEANLYLALACVLLCGMNGIDKELPLRPPRHESTETQTPLPTSLAESLEYLEKDDALQRGIPESLLRAYVAVRRVEAQRSSSLTHEDEVQEALRRA